MKKQIKDLSLHELDFLVAKVEGLEPIVIRNNECHIANWKYSPTTNPTQSWPIIERERIKIDPSIIGDFWISSKDQFDFYSGGTSLEAAMRCYVASKFGDEVDMDNLINK